MHASDVGVRLIECVGHLRSALINMHACAHTYRTCLVLVSWFGRVDHCRSRHCLVPSRMGKKERKRSRDDSSTDEERQRRHKHEKHKKKKSTHKKHKRGSGSDSSGSDSDADARLAAAKAFLQQHLANNPAPAAGPLPPSSLPAAEERSSKPAKQKSSSSSGRSFKPPGVKDLTADDYFEKSSEFTAWLLEEEHKYFNELSSEETHSYFGRFVAAWNVGQLAPRYYQGLVAAPLKRTSHQWGFKAQGAAAGRQRVGMTAFMEEEKERHTEQRAAGRASEAAARKAWRREQREELDELLPKPTAGSKEAKAEQRAARREAAKAREDSPDRVWVTGGGDVMGGDDSFAAAKAREAKRQEWRNQKATAQREQLAARAAEAAAAEAAKMAQFRQLVASAGTITIPKRAPQ